jgi:hypothetical protein
VIKRGDEHLTRSGFAARIGQPRAFESQFLPTAKGVNSPEGKFLDALTRPETSVAKLSYPLNQIDQARCHLRLSPLIIDERWEQMHVRPLRLDMHIN